ncbi:PREDICTED: ubiquitin-conjugating enzyme E2 S isoform X1 [Diuraphis noxia]|uniref:ubiquitin-conjugating enzyme E2 S isoform X1 n=1 Tax=Diuraphis noxia TaxID=143948 RepID=UPI000763B657|nr:PREDICTED: ubiquitin-conjugating enzyme E2 S isoform X1 [Diuraphis noxia]
MSSISNVENLSPQTIRRLVREQEDLIKDPPEGIRIVVNDSDVTDIQAFIDGPAGTPYAGGRFNVKLVLGKDFPHTPPKAYFLTKIFHPNVASSGEICVNTLKRDWKPDLGIKHILLTIKCLLIVPNAESALNEEAGKLLLEEYDHYFQRAQMITEIHAPIPKSMKIGREEDSSDGPLAKKHAGNKTIEKKRISKDKRKTLKRL